MSALNIFRSERQQTALDHSAFGAAHKCLIHVVNIFMCFVSADGAIDIEEFEYVLSNFDIPAKEARACFVIFSEVNQTIVCELCLR